MITYFTDVYFMKKLYRISVVLILCALLFTSCKRGGMEAASDINRVMDSVAEVLSKIKTSKISTAEKNDQIDVLSKFVGGINNDTLQRNLYLEIAKAYDATKNPKSFRRTHNHILYHCLNNRDSVGIAKSYYGLGRHFLRNEKIDSAYQHYFFAERIFKSLDMLEYAGRSRLTMAIIQKNVKDYVGGEESSIRSLEYFTPSNNLRYLASAANNIGLIANEQEQYDKAIEYHKVALEQREEYGDSTLISGSLNNIGLVYFNQGNYSKAIDYYNMGLDYDSLHIKKPLSYARLLDNLANAKFLQGEHNTFPESFLRPLAIRDSMNDNLGMVTSNLHLARCYREIDSLAQTELYAQRALQYANPLSYNRGILESLLLLSEISEEKRALKFAKRYIVTADSLAKEERNYQNQFARIRFETDAIELENEKVTRQKKRLTLLLMGLAIVSLLTYIFIQRKLAKKEVNFNKAQQTANEEIYQLMLSQKAKFEEGKQLEKQRISEELHDGILGRMFGTRLNLDGLNNKNGDEVALKRATYIEELKKIENEIRKISHELSANEFTQDTLFVDVVENLIEKLCGADAKHTIAYTFDYDETVDWNKIPNAIKVHIYRIIQETLYNVIKHSEATNLNVVFGKNQEYLEFEIQDNGVGMVVDKVKNGIGLKNIKSRVKQIKGSLDISSIPTKGTKIGIKLII